MKKRMRLRWIIPGMVTLGLVITLTLRLLDVVDSPRFRGWVQQQVEWVFGPSPPSSTSAPPPLPSPPPNSPTPTGTAATTGQIAITLDREDATYVRGEEVHVTVVSNQPGHLYVFARDPSGAMTCVWPREDGPGSPVSAGQLYQLTILVKQPFGRHQLVGTVTAEEVRGTGEALYRTLQSRRAQLPGPDAQNETQMLFWTIDPHVP